MLPTAILALATEIIRLVNTLLEGKSIEQRAAEALIWFRLTWPLVKPFIPASERAAIEQQMASVVASMPEEKP
jgi:hypothetical protein